MADVSRALADPFTRARFDALIDHFRTRGVRMLRSNIIAALTDAGLDTDAAEILAEAVLARIRERVSPAARMNATPNAKGFSIGRGSGSGRGTGSHGEVHNGP